MKKRSDIKTNSSADNNRHSDNKGSNSFNNTLKFATLAPVQRQTLDFLRNYLAEKGFAPTLKEIADRIGVKSVSTAHFHLERLEQKGHITRGPNGSLEIHEVERPEQISSGVPLVGVIAAGTPIDAYEESTTTIDVPSTMITGKGEVFCLEVSGESMIEKHICDGDIVVVKKQDYADDGQIVVALLDDGSATLKTYRRLKNGKVMLIPANPALQPITLDSVSVQGKVIGVLRHLH